MQGNCNYILSKSKAKRVEHSRVKDGVASDPQDQATWTVFYTCSLTLKSSSSTDQDQVPGVAHSFAVRALYLSFFPSLIKPFLGSGQRGK